MPSRVTKALMIIKGALYSRYLFDNWFSLLIRYALIRLGFNVKLVARVGDCTFELSPEVFGRVVGGFLRGLIRSIECNGKRLIVNNMEITNINDLINAETYAKVLGWVYDSINQYWFRGNARFKHMHDPIIWIFHYGDYESLGIEGRVVVDVGAFVGDSAVYFALRGAKRIIAIEPHPGAFAEMLDNIKLNNMEGVIIPVNAGLAGRPGKICIENTNTYDTKYVYHRPGDCANAVPAVTLDELINKFGVDPNDAVIKMDCEGCEFDVILNDYEHVRLFRELILEYHPKHVNKSVDELLKVLSRDYKCDIKGSKDLGIMHCIRK
jgi:FkbM family methyltransferase